MPEKYRRPREHEMRQTVERMQQAWEGACVHACTEQT